MLLTQLLDRHCSEIQFRQVCRKALHRMLACFPLDFRQTVRVDVFNWGRFDLSAVFLVEPFIPTFSVGTGFPVVSRLRVPGKC
jgi:hypothetical protein